MTTVVVQTALHERALAANGLRGEDLTESGPVVVGRSCNSAMRVRINVGPGQRYDVIWKARGPGKWLLHCHIGHHTTNNNSETNGGGGLMVILDVSG